MNTIDSIISQFSNKTLPKEQWTHHAHIAVAFAYLEKYKTVELTLPQVRTDISAYNLSVGTANTNDSGYHETITAFWITLVHEYYMANPWKDENAAFVEFIQTDFAKSDFPLTFYSRELLFSTLARLKWVEPDLVPMSKISEIMGALENQKDDMR